MSLRRGRSRPSSSRPRSDVIRLAFDRGGVGMRSEDRRMAGDPLKLQVSGRPRRRSRDRSYRYSVSDVGDARVRTTACSFLPFRTLVVLSELFEGSFGRGDFSLLAVGQFRARAGAGTGTEIGRETRCRGPVATGGLALRGTGGRSVVVVILVLADFDPFAACAAVCEWTGARWRHGVEGRFRFAGSPVGQVGGRVHGRGAVPTVELRQGTELRVVACASSEIRQHSTHPQRDVVGLGLGQAFRLDGAVATGAEVSAIEIFADVFVQDPTDGDLRSRLQVLRRHEEEVIITAVGEDGLHLQVGPAAASDVSAAGAFVPRVDVDGKLRVEEDEGGGMAQDLPTVVGILTVIVHVTDVSFELADDVAFGNEGVDGEILPHGVLAGEDDAAILADLPLDVGKGEFFDGSVEPVKDVLRRASVGGLGEGVPIAGPDGQAAGDADGVEQVGLHGPVAGIVLVEAHELEAVRFAVVAVHGQMAGGMFDGARRALRGGSGALATIDGERGRSRVRADRTGTAVARLGSFGRGRLVLGASAATLADGACLVLLRRTPSVQLDGTGVRQLDLLLVTLGGRALGLLVAEVGRVPLAALSLVGAPDVQGPGFAVGAVVDVRDLLLRRVVAGDVLPGFARLTEDGAAIVLGEAADAFDRVRLILLDGLLLLLLLLLQGGRAVGLGGGSMDRAGDRIEQRRGVRVEGGRVVCHNMTDSTRRVYGERR